MKFWGLGRLLLAAWIISWAVTAAWADNMAEAGNPVIPLHVGQTVVQAEVVSSPEKLYAGLGGRRHLKPDRGMLFVMPALAVQEFCMRGMLIPIDIIWIAQNQVIGFHQNLSPDDSGTFTSPGPADLVLEVPAGFVAASGLRIGDRLQRLN